VLWAPAEKNTTCAECLEIARQINEAYADERSKVDPYAPSPSTGTERTQAASRALQALIGGTEEDAERADELLDPFRYQLSPGVPQLRFPPQILAALRRGFQHTGRTGHWLRKIAG
jgi:hypothetical protein